MVTNQIIKRPMGVFEVEQRTKDGMFNATALLRKWNENHPDEKRDMDNFWKSTNLSELMSEIAENELGFKSVDFTELKNMLSVTSRGKYNGGTWMNPILFLKFAMYLSPRFEYHVLKFVSDQMIKFRKDAGDAYKRISIFVWHPDETKILYDFEEGGCEEYEYRCFSSLSDLLKQIKGDMEL